MTAKLLVPNTIHSNIAMPVGVELRVYDVEKSIDTDLRDAAGLVLWGCSPAWMARAAIELPRLRWVQTLSAGYEDVLLAKFSQSATICNGATLHNAPVAEHALALILECVRRLDLLLEAQRAHHWSDRGGLQSFDNTQELTTLFGASVAIVGFGGIGKTLAQHLTGLGAIVTGVARQRGVRDGFPVIEMDELEQILPSVDVLVLILPADESTRHVIGRSQLSKMKPSAWLVNVGRGSCVDQDVLFEYLNEHRLAGAALDVFDSEPLSAGAPAWDIPNLIISPHAAGGRPRGYQALIARNALSMVTGKTLLNAVRTGR